MGISAAIGTIGSAVVGGAAQSSAASKAAKAQTNAANQANATSREFFDITQKNLKPYINTGNLANDKISKLEGLDGSDGSTIQATLESLPGYQFAKQQGLKSVQNSAAARGLGASGAALKGAASYATGLANETYNNLLTGVQDTQHVGANAAAGLGNAATATGANIGNNLIGAGNAQAAGALQQGSAISNAASGLPNGLVASQLLQNQNNLSPTSYLNINNDGAISNAFDNANKAYSYTPTSGPN